ASCRTDGAAGAAERRVAGGWSAGWGAGLGAMTGGTGVGRSGGTCGVGRTCSAAAPFSATGATVSAHVSCSGLPSAEGPGADACVGTHEGEALSAGAGRATAGEAGAAGVAAAVGMAPA